MLTRAQFAELASKAQVDPKQLIEQLFVVQTKQLSGQQPLAKLLFNRAQQKVHDAVLQKRQAGEPPRVIVLKARQPGISTLGCGYVGATALCSPYSQSMIVAHLEEASVGLFKKIQFMYDRLPPDFSPKRKASRREEMRVDGLNCSDGEVQLNTAITVATASGGELWRGRTLQTVHLSEFSAFPRADSVLVGIMQAVPPTPQSLVVIESTARGMGNAFHEEWTRAVANESDFVPVFIGWWEIPEYRMPVSAEFQLEPEEKELKKALGLTNEQIQWRRYVLFTQCRGSEDYFNQEYPLSPGVAFLTTGRPAFNTKVLQEMYDLAMKFTPERGEMHEDGFSPNRHRQGNFTVYRRPESGHDYTIGADPSAGVEGGDPAAIQVMDRTRMEQVAVWHGLAEPIRFAQIINHVGRWYNNAMIAPELNGGWGFCVKSGTYVHSPGGDRRIEELVGTQPWVYGVRDGDVVLARANRVWKTMENTACVRVVFEWQPGGRPLTRGELVCTPDHPIMLLSGEFVKAGQLRWNDRLMPFQQNTAWMKRPGAQPRAYLRISRESLKWENRARWVWSQLHGPIPDGWHVHHRDGNPLNDDPDNLECLPGKQHNSEHSRERYNAPGVRERHAELIRKSWENPETRALRLERQRIALQDPAERARRSRQMSERNRKRKLPDGMSENHRVVAVEPAGSHDVYDMEVPGIHNFAANGIVVHNSVVEELTKGYQYPRIYIWQRVDKVKRSISNYYGWWTTNSTRPLLIDSTNFAINEKELLLRDAATIKELLEFQYFDGRRAEGLRHDDLAMAWMIAYRLHLETPMESTGLPPRVRFTDDTAAKVEIPTYTRGIDKDAWEGADQALEGMKKQAQSGANEWDSPDQEPGEVAGFVPDWPW